MVTLEQVTVHSAEYRFNPIKICHSYKTNKQSKIIISKTNFLHLQFISKNGSLRQN